MNTKPVSNEKIIELDDKKYNSAGVLIIHRFSSKDCVVLFKSSMYVPSGVNKGKYYCDIPGGGIDLLDNTIEDTASRELFEESKKLISISSKNLKLAKDIESFIELPGRRLSGKRKAGLFACFVCKLSNVSSKIYNKNKDILKKIKMDPVFYETIELVRIPISHIKEYFKDKKISKNNARLKMLMMKFNILQFKLLNVYFWLMKKIFTMVQLNFQIIKKFLMI